MVESVRHQTIVEYVDKLQVGLNELRERARRLQVDYEADRTVVEAEIARYESLITDARRQAAEEKRFVAEITNQKDALLKPRRPSSAKSSTTTDFPTNVTKTAKAPSKLKAVQVAAEQIVREEGRAMKRSELTRRLQLVGYLVDSDNPIDLLRKALSSHEVLKFDVKIGYYISPQ